MYGETEIRELKIKCLMKFEKNVKLTKVETNIVKYAYLNATKY